ncbi:DUF4860 domain-containing protein [Clostridium sp. D33t1_170424_F3]|uniref:DUF4860 domain-containing protein n=1 Tax=Clostridium sp. D33t1_170424_F3 TaxID=2787099 RepID=UPI0018AA490B
MLLLFTVFAAVLLLVLFTGANSYRRVAERGAGSYNRRLCAQYIATKVRHGDREGAVFVGGFSEPDRDDGISTLYLRQEIEGATYDTRIYWYDGAVRELFAEADGAFEPQDGNEVLQASALKFFKEENILTVETETETLILSLRSGREAAA